MATSVLVSLAHDLEGKEVWRYALAFAVTAGVCFLLLMLMIHREWPFWTRGKVARLAADERKRKRLEKIRRQLEPGASFRAHGPLGDVIHGTVVEVLDSSRVVAWCRSERGGSEQGTFPIDKIEEVYDTDG